MSKSKEYKVSIHLTESEYKSFIAEDFVDTSNGCCGVYDYHLILEDVHQQIVEQIKPKEEDSQVLPKDMVSRSPVRCG